MRKLHRHVTVRVERETAETFHAVMAGKGLTASAYLRDAIRSAVAANDSAPPSPISLPAVA
ncbi:hypothetical protein [Methylobacterium sp. R2-1]|uniref:hypothetical protein n=1 Tax=Methylobacterium sp. R2-1 TaxID=2587064 RepID=UPI001608DF60|nr:hypothetical protein [Methylobacterium sp. R2-1]MBB2961815.1 hypothetical protein [Methylobacterium sp. R2-1]